MEKVNVDKIIGQWESEAGIVLAEAQKEAIHASLKYGVFVLTGGPGTGKNDVIKGILAVLKKLAVGYSWQRLRDALPRRLADSSGHPAVTVHRLLEYTPNGGGFNFGKNDGDPLDADAIIIDEASMLDITLTYHLLKAVQGGCRLIFCRRCRPASVCWCRICFKGYYPFAENACCKIRKCFSSG